MIGRGGPWFRSNDPLWHQALVQVQRRTAPARRRPQPNSHHVGRVILGTCTAGSLKKRQRPQEGMVFPQRRWAPSRLKQRLLEGIVGPPAALLHLKRPLEGMALPPPCPPGASVVGWRDPSSLRIS